jgi:shikimate kinase
MFDLQGLKNIYLIGMMGAGKSTIGKSLAERLQYKFIDTDTEIEKEIRQSITAFFETNDEEKFRQIETKLLAEIPADKQLVVATGGGIAIKLENWNHLQQGLVIWLDVSLDVLVERLKNDRTRPILNTPGELRPKLQEILAARCGHYNKANLHIPIRSNLPPTEVVEQIMKKITS